jgi:hypothetical protein
VVSFIGGGHRSTRVFYGKQKNNGNALREYTLLQTGTIPEKLNRVQCYREKRLK